MQRLTAFLTRKGEEYLAVCPELELQTQGDTIDEALDHLWEEMEDYYLSVNSRSELAEDPENEVEVDFLGWKH